MSNQDAMQWASHSEHLATSVASRSRDRPAHVAQAIYCASEPLLIVEIIESLLIYYLYVLVSNVFELTHLVKS